MRRSECAGSSDAPRSCGRGWVAPALASALWIVALWSSSVLLSGVSVEAQQLHHWTGRPAQIPSHQWGFRSSAQPYTWRFPRLTQAGLGEAPPVQWTEIPTAEQLRDRLELLGLSQSQKEQIDRLWNNYQYLAQIDRDRRQEEIYRVNQRIARAQRFERWERAMQLRQYLDLLYAGERAGWSVFASQLLRILTWDQERLLYAIEYPADARSRFEMVRMESEALDVTYAQMQRARQLHEEYEAQRATRRSYEARELGYYRQKLQELQEAPVRDEWAIADARRTLEERYRQLQAEHLLRERMYADRLNATLTTAQSRKLVAMAEGRGRDDRPSDIEWLSGLPSDEPVYGYGE